MAERLNLGKGLKEFGENLKVLVDEVNEKLTPSEISAGVTSTNTLPAGSSATASASWNATSKKINFTFGIPKGDTGAQGAKGDKGDQGIQGVKGDAGTSVTVSSTSVTYQASSSGTTAPTGTWSTTIPSVSNGQYLWTRTIVNYSDGKSTTSYAVGYKGTNGINGTTPTIQAANGTNVGNVGTPSVTASTSGTTTTFTFNYLKGAKGDKGDPGTNGTNGTNGVTPTIKVANGTNIGSVGTPTVSASTSGTTTTFTFDYLKGAKGDKGDKGDAGTNGTNGTNGVTPTIKAANGSNIGSVGTPSVTASTSGTTTTFTFNYLKGEKGDKGDAGTNATTTAVATATANGLMSSSDKSKLDGIDAGAQKIWYGTCSTAATTTAKTVTLSGFTLKVGACVLVKMSNTSTSTSDHTLNVNSTGAKTIRAGQSNLTVRYVSTYSASYQPPWKAGAYCLFIYDGTYWVWENAPRVRTFLSGTTLYIYDN